MADDADIAGNNVDEFNADALAEHQRKMGGMEFVDLEEGTECEDCGRPLIKTTKARKDSGLCGECYDFYHKGKNIGKFRGEY